MDLINSQLMSLEDGGELRLNTWQLDDDSIRHSGVMVVAPDKLDASGGPFLSRADIAELVRRAAVS